MPSHALVPEFLRRNARRMRKDMTDAELRLWNQLRAHRLMGLGFRRQYPIRNDIADFACPDHRLIVELDGTQHGDPIVAARDSEWTRALEQDGWTVLRFWNDDVMRDLEAVCNHIVAVCGVRP